MRDANKRPPRESAAVILLVVGVMAVVTGGCEQAAPAGESEFVEACVRTDMPANLCSCMDEEAQSSLDESLYSELVTAAQSAADAREAGSEDGMMDHLPEDLSEEDSSTLVRFVMSVRGRCLPE
ncbi:hypothetical protein WNY37_12745 [Henriciella sp. AS95]|uniref:hypothetical protein n=1 Tax=Henriciella sp. AS95 TaxID=3135782 RepID=UPI00316D8278